MSTQVCYVSKPSRLLKPQTTTEKKSLAEGRNHAVPMTEREALPNGH